MIRVSRERPLGGKSAAIQRDNRCHVNSSLYPTAFNPIFSDRYAGRPNAVQVKRSSLRGIRIISMDFPLGYQAGNSYVFGSQIAPRVYRERRLYYRDRVVNVNEANRRISIRNHRPSIDETKGADFIFEFYFPSRRSTKDG